MVLVVQVSDGVIIMKEIVYAMLWSLGITNRICHNMETADRRSYHVKLCNFVAYRDSEYLNIIECPLQKKTYS